MKLIFVHGSADTGECYYYQTRHFKGSEAVSLPGHPDGVPCGSAELYAEWLRGYIHGKGYGRDVVLAGHSLGGAIVLLYALKYPDEVKAVVPLGSGPYFHIDPERQWNLKKAANGDKKEYETWLSQQAARSPGLPEDVAKHELETRIKMGPGILHHDLSCCMGYNIVDRLHEIKAPVFALAATGDPYCPPADSYALAEGIPNCRVKVIEGPTHWMIIDRPKETNQAIEEFLKTLK
jgi:pimeloyl-ACP methyl ester carboxylesterase